MLRVMKPAPDMERARMWLYKRSSWTEGFASAVEKRLIESFDLVNINLKAGQNKPVSYLDHAWGEMSPQVQNEAVLQMLALCQLGNPSWDILFGRVMPKAAQNISSVLGLPYDESIYTTHFGHNSHELVLKLISCAIDAKAGDTVRMMTSDTEFYSLTRQLNRLAQSTTLPVSIDVVAASPANTFQERLIACVSGQLTPDQTLHSPACRNDGPQSGSRQAVVYDFIYVSQITYLTQETLLPDVAEAVEQLVKICQDEECQVPYIVIDGYHAFGAVPTDISRVIDKCYYVAGMLKHIGCGPNCAFMTVPSSRPVQPLFTGWLADPSVLGPGSDGISIGSSVGYHSTLALQGGTPGFMQPLLTFNTLMEVWRNGPDALDVAGAGLLEQPAEPDMVGDSNKQDSSDLVHRSGRPGADGPSNEDNSADDQKGKPGRYRWTITVADVHGHVLSLHAVFLDGLQQVEHTVIRPENLVNLQECQAVQSHTLVFKCSGGAEEAAAVVQALQAKGCLVDCRKQYVRIGFGFNHSIGDVQMLLDALQAAG